MSKLCSVSNSGVTSNPGALRWSLPRQHLILSDINMPGMSGLEMLPKVRAERPDVPVIMITAYGDAETRRKAIERGAVGLLTKPIDFALLRHEIDTRLGQAA
jgi:CheY-like chemotaxis protein